MGLLSRIARIAQRFGVGRGSAVVTQEASLAGTVAGMPTPKLMTAEERRQVLDQATPEQMRYTEWQTGRSSWIAALRFNPVAQFAQMKVKRYGKVYTFGGMSFDIFLGWLRSGSWGKYFNTWLKGRYTQWAGFSTTGRGIRATRERQQAIESGTFISGLLGER